MSVTTIQDIDGRPRRIENLNEAEIISIAPEGGSLLDHYEALMRSARDLLAAAQVPVPADQRKEYEEQVIKPLARVAASLQGLLISTADKGDKS